MLYVLLEDILRLRERDSAIRNIDIRGELEAIAGAVSFDWVVSALKHIDELVEIGSPQYPEEPRFRCTGLRSSSNMPDEPAAHSYASAGPPASAEARLATRGNSRLEIEDVEHAIERGINYLNWCGHPDALSGAVTRSGANRRRLRDCCSI